MSEKIYVVGHKSPDLDSVAGAIAYAKLRNILENSDQYIPAISGEANKETKFSLEKFGFSLPEILIDAKGKNVIMVDHNEFAQAVDGIENAKILSVVDHHKMDFRYSEPICVNVRPWGATCTIIAHWYLKNNLEIEKEMAGLMLSAILVDTVITKSPTCTEMDKKIITQLTSLAGIADWKEFGMEIFKVRASVSDLTDEQVIKNDWKDFEFKSGKFGVGQIETVDLDDLRKREESLLNKLSEIKVRDDYHTVILFLTDIINEGSKFLVLTDNKEGFKKAMGKDLENNRVYIEGILSRKKQVAPRLTEVFDK